MASSQVPAELVRNMCILAHVDHGKTTCADNLVASNGIISRQSAGKIRYMDSRVDEQERQITMKSSSISLQWTGKVRKGTGLSEDEGSPQTYLVNLIDSPGHVDFTSEVSTAARLADGALVVVDVVEGVAAQTRTVLRQAWRDRVKTVLFLNKIDRLITELELTPLEAYQRLKHIVQDVNAVNQQMLSEETMARAAEEQEAAGNAEGIDLSANVLEFDMEAEKAWTYSPESGNVAFGSASHGWAFCLSTFSRLIAGKMGARPENVQRVLWGEWFFNKKTKQVQRRKADDEKTKPMFVEFVLAQIFAVYEATYKSINTELLTKMQAHIAGWKGVDIGHLTPGSAAVRELLPRWLPFAEAVLRMSAEQLPSPKEAAPSRLPVLCPRWFADDAVELGPLAKSLRAHDASGPTIAYLAKFLGADLERLALTGDTLVGDEDVQFVGVCRVFSGTLRPGQDLYVTEEEGSATRVLRVQRIFVLKGRFLEVVPEALAGSIVATEVIEVGVDGSTQREIGVERCLTLSESPEGPFLETPYSSQAFALVRVSIEPKSVTDLEALERGLRLLHKADPSVSVEAMVTGENVLGCCGDEHLKRCINDLQKLFARGIPLTISPPLVAVRESIATSVPAERIDPKASALWLPSWAAHLVDASTEASSVFSAHDDDPAAEGDVAKAHHQERLTMSSAGIMSVWTANRKACVKVRAMALPDAVLEWMDDHAEDLEMVVHRQRSSMAFAGSKEAVTLGECLDDISQHISQKLTEAEDFAGDGLTLCGLSVARGCRVALLDASGSIQALRDSYRLSGGADVDEDQDATSERVPRASWPSVLAGFQLAAAAGPLCEEPMRGVAFVLLGFQQVTGDESAGYPGAAVTASQRDQAAAAAAGPYGPMSGQVMMAVKEACRCSLYRRGFARICEAMLSLEVQCEQAVLGKVYGVLGKRRAKVLDEGLRDGTSMFYINSHLPLADSLGIAQDLREAASGHVSFHCAFSHWERSDEDPFQEASLTAEELEELGDQPLPPNVARRLIDAIRKRKGLATDEKVVKDATKQRTVTRMK